MARLASSRRTLDGAAASLAAIEPTVEAALRTGRLVAVGSAEVQFAGSAIEQPSSFSVRSTEGHGTLEFQLALARQ